jgi:hypothetical protein
MPVGAMCRLDQIVDDLHAQAVLGGPIRRHDTGCGQTATSGARLGRLRPTSTLLEAAGRRGDAARRVQLGVGVGLVLLLGVVLALVLLRDPAGGSPSASPPTQPVPTRPDMDQLRAEAAAAAETLFRKIDEADATGNPAVLDGLYTEGARIPLRTLRRGPSANVPHKVSSASGKAERSMCAWRN